MWIVKIEANANGSHDDHRADHITFPPDGWAMIPEDFALPASYPFGEITAEEITYTREVESLDEEGNVVTAVVEYTMVTVTAMTEGTLPDPTPESDEISDSEALRIITGEVDINETN